MSLRPRLPNTAAVTIVCLCLILFMLFLTGCANRQPPTPEKGAVLPTGALLYDVVMPSGVHCVALVGTNKGGVDCDFDTVSAELDSDRPMFVR